MKPEKIRLKIKGKWIDIKEPHQTQDCEAIEIRTLMTKKEIKELYPEYYEKYFN